jgi:hypothetical protein
MSQIDDILFSPIGESTDEVDIYYWKNSGGMWSWRMNSERARNWLTYHFGDPDMIFYSDHTPVNYPIGLGHKWNDQLRTFRCEEIRVAQ